MKIITLATVFLCILCACNKNTISYERAYDMDTSHTIPIDNALKELDAFLAADLTKGSNFKISDTLTIYSSHKTVTKGSSPEELLYVVNFEENAGSAILAADDRISAKVIAVTESGQFALKDFKKIENANRTFPDFSLNGPGMYPNPLDTTDIIINPNTFELYNPEVDDYYIGNLLVSDNTPATINKCDDTEENKQLLSVLIIDYAEGEIGKNTPQTPVDTFKRHIFDEGYEERVSYETTKRIIVSPLLSQFVYWAQEDDCNLFSPIHFGKLTPNGCVPLAISKILAFHKYPHFLSYNDYPIDWEILSSKKGRTEINKFQISLLTRLVGVGSNSIYSSQGTFTFPSLAANFMSEFCEYKNVQYSKYDTDSVLDALRNNCPIFICSIPDKVNIFCAHGWNIDGYMVKSTITRIDYYKDGIFIKSAEATTSNKMVHCDFGWESTCNGYYYSGIFDLTKNNYYPDNTLTARNKYNFNGHLKTITYEIQ